MSHEVLTPELVDRLESLSQPEQAEYLFLEPSPEFRGCWHVDSLWPEFFFDFEPIIGNYRLVTPFGLDVFLQAADEKGYKIVFTDAPEVIIDAYSHYRDEPAIALESTLPNTVRGFLPWQVAGYNKLVKDESIRAGYVVWDTGAGKTAFIASAVKFHMEVGHPFNLALIVVKSHNKIDTCRKLKSLASIETIIVDGYNIQKRLDAYEEIELKLVAGEPVVAITNYEKFREDRDFFKFIVRNRDCLFFWDEMPTRLSNPKTLIYKDVKKSLYDSFYSKPRPNWMRHWILTATPIENTPGGVWACVNLAWPGLLGTKAEFENMHVAYRHQVSGQPQRWHKLDRLEAKLGFMTHRVSKEDPEVAKMFPEVMDMPTTIDWNPKHRRVYDKLAGKAQDLVDELEDANILALIQIMQMVCDAPSMVAQSAHNRVAFENALEEFGDLDEGLLPFRGPKGSDIAVTLLSALDPGSLTDIGHTKLATWKEIITEKHPDEKIVTHSTWAQYIFPIWEYWLDKWEVSYVTYSGTSKQKQDALDLFRKDSSIRVFLSGDSGADSIDIAEAKVGVNYNIPWKWTTLRQREGRRDRVDSTFDTIFTYSLIMPDSVDERKLEVCERKKGYHQAVFDGRATEESISATMTRSDLLYILSGIQHSTDAL